MTNLFRRRPRWLANLLLVGVTLSLTLFQACSGCGSRVAFNGNQSSVLAANDSGGDGRPIDSKPGDGTYYHVVPGDKCNTSNGYAAAVEVKGDQVRHHLVDAQTCTETVNDLSPKKVTWSRLNETVLGYETGIFQKLERPPLDTPDFQTHLAPLPESWCRVRTSDLAVDVLVNEVRTTRVLTSPVSSARLQNGVWSNVTTQSVAVTRQSRGTILSYAGADLMMTIDRAQRLDDGSVRGRVYGRIAGAQVDSEATCLTGSEFDASIPLTPTFAMNFGSVDVPGGLSLARATTGTFFDMNGNLVNAGANMPRMEFDPVSHLSKGLLLEAASVNLLLDSGDLSQPAWISTGLLVQSDGTIAGVSASRIVANDPTATLAWGRASQNVNIVAGQPYALSFFAARGNQNLARVFIWSSAGNEINVDFDLANGTSSVFRQNALSVIATSVTPIGDGYRVGVAFSSSLSGVVGIGIGPNSVTAGDYIRATAAQLEPGDMITSYIPTTTTVASRGEDQLRVLDLSWFNRAQGTLHAAVTQDTIARRFPTQFLFSLTGAGADMYSVFLDLDTTFSALLRLNTNTLSWPGPSTLRRGFDAVQQVALAYSNVDAVLAVNGSVQNAPGAPPLGLVPLQMVVGGANGENPWSGHLRALTYWPSRLENGNLIDRTK